MSGKPYKARTKPFFNARNGTTLAIKYKPHPHQVRFADAIASGKRVVLFLGGRRGGKTYGGSFESLKQIYKYCRQPNLGWIVSPTYPMSLVTQKAFEEAAGFAEDGGLILRKYRGDRSYMLYPNKLSQDPYKVEVKSAEHPDRLRGAGLGWIWIDEAAMISEECWKILLGCVVDTQGIIFMTTTPRGRNWLYSRVYQESLTNPRYAVITASSFENKSLIPEELQELRSQYSADFAKQEIDAEFVSFDGLVYRPFDYSTHVINPITQLPDGAELISGIDFGWEDPFVHLWIMKYGGKFYVIDEYYATSRTMETHARSVKSNQWDKHVLRRWADPSAAQACADLMNYGVGTYPARNDIEAGIDCVRRMFEQKKLLISKTCLNTLKELSEYHYKKREGANTKDIPVDFANHTMDALRYALYSESNYSRAHPYIEKNDDGTMTVYGDDANPLSNRLEDWVKLPGMEPFGSGNWIVEE